MTDRVWVRISKLCGGGEVYSNNHFWLFTRRHTVSENQRRSNQMTLRHEEAFSKSYAKARGKVVNVFVWFHSLNPQTQTLCNRSSKRTVYGYYLLEKLLQLNSKLWSMAITPFDHHLLFNRPVAYVRLVPIFSSISPFCFLFSYRHWCNAVFLAVSDNEQRFDLTICHWNVRFPSAIEQQGASVCNAETNGRRIECMRVARCAIASNE